MLKYGFFFLILHLANSGYVGHVSDFSGTIGDQCQYDSDCLTQNSFCRNHRRCVCKDSYSYDEDSNICYPTKLGLRCQETYDCSALNNAQCIEEVCQCSKGYVAPEDGKSCLQSSRLMASCQDDSQCLASDLNSQCNRNTKSCECKQNYHPQYDTQTCIPTKRLRDPCENHASCAATIEQHEKVECRPDNDGQSKCFCRAGFSSAGNVCVKGESGDGGSATATISVICLITAIFIHLEAV